MNLNFSIKPAVTVILLLVAGMLSAQSQYTINEDRSRVSLVINQNKTKLTVDNVLRRKMGQPLLEAQRLDLKIDIDTVGVWSELQSSGEKIWKLIITVPGAKGFFVSFDEFYLPQGAKLYAYNENSTKQAVLYSHDDNPEGGAYSFENIRGDNVVLEYVSPANIQELPRIKILDIGYKYIEDQNSDTQGYDDRSNSCMININCIQGSPWQAQKKSVLRIRTTRIDGQTNLCSGTLINNTKEDKKPYILTANHCFELVDTANINNIEVYFEYESSTCDNELPTYKYHKGGKAKVLGPIKSGSDGALILLTGTIPDSWNVYFNGWDITNNTTSGGAVIHHPQGDIKKITLYDKALVSGVWDGTSPSNSFWIIDYSEGVTERGSSGAPIFNRNGLVVGTLTGGDSSCSLPNRSDRYGKLWYHWDKSSDTDQHMNVYLDPENTGKKSLEGIFNNPSLNKEIILERANMVLSRSAETKVEIIDGNGSYRVTSSNDDIVSGSIVNTQVRINANKVGTAILTVRDGNGQRKDINVVVRPNIDFYLDNDKNLTVTVHDDEDAIKEIRIINLDADVLYNKKNIGESSFVIDRALFRKGMYIIQIKTMKGVSRTEKIIW